MNDFTATAAEFGNHSFFAGTDPNIVYYTCVDPSWFEIDEEAEYHYTQFVPIIRRPPNEGWCSCSSSLPFENN